VLADIISLTASAVILAEREELSGLGTHIEPVRATAIVNARDKVTEEQRGPHESDLENTSRFDSVLSARAPRSRVGQIDVRLAVTRSELACRGKSRYQ
jgi:hypothetical protein